MPRPGPEGFQVRGVVTGDYATILTPEALAFVASLARRHTDTVHELLARRKAVQARYDTGGRPHFLPQTKHVRSLYQVGLDTPSMCASTHHAALTMSMSGCGR